MRRPPGLWILLSVGVLWISLQNTHGLRATSLIFAKSTTTTTTTEEPEHAEDEVATTEPPLDGNSTKPTLTGNPQLDYVHDPNLPKELNGYTLSDYPFYERVPEDIDFKCDGLHDGFYASVAHKCQVYHHCLSGTRYDFLCANYTAFDQTLFNCNFVSNVDCANSKNFWHRNDELYKTKSTTTAAPIIYNFYTPPPGATPLTVSPVGISPSVDALGQLPVYISPAVIPKRRLRPAAVLPVPRRPQRPLYDYYEDDYEEPPRPAARRKRPRPRPVYYDDYEYEDDGIGERRSGGRRRPYDRQPSRTRSKDRRKDDYDDEDRIEDEDYILSKKQKNKRRKPADDYEYEDESRDRSEKRRKTNRRENPRKRPVDDYDDEKEEEIVGRRRNRDDDRDARRDRYEDNKPARLQGKRRPPSEEYEDNLQQADDPRSYENLKRSNKENSYKKPDDGRAVIKPVSGTIYDRPRLAPRINLPVPKNAADKYAYKPLEGEIVSKRTDAEESVELEEGSPIDSSTLSTKTFNDEDYSDTPVRSSTKRTKLEIGSRKNSQRVAAATRKRPVVETFKDNSRTQVPRSTSTTPASSTVAESSTGTVVRKFKRPFLPSRGGNPYASRNLQAVGNKSVKNSPAVEASREGRQDLKYVSSSTVDDDYEEIQVGYSDLKQNPTINKSPIGHQKTTDEDNAKVSVEMQHYTSENTEKSVPVRIKIPIRMKSTAETDNTQFENEQNRQSYLYNFQQPKRQEADVLNENYDVTLNEAISPVLPLPVRGYQAGFSSANDYTYSRFQRPTKYVILDPVVSADSKSYYVK